MSGVDFIAAFLDVMNYLVFIMASLRSASQRYIGFDMYGIQVIELRSVHQLSSEIVESM